MSQRNKISDILFYITLILVIVLCILGTFFAIKKHNVNNKKVTNNEEERIPFLNFASVEESKIVDVFKSYPINPIDISFENNTVSISGLKNKEIEKKINEKLSIFDSTKNQYGNNLCSVNFNMSNVLSIGCNGKRVAVNLVDGEDIKLEEIFNKGTDIYSILVRASYDGLCSWHGCYPKYDFDYEYDSNIENQVSEFLQNIKNNNYEVALYENSIGIGYMEDESTYIEFSSFKDDITIYDRFLKDGIYENKITDYCSPNSCYHKINGQSEYSYDIDEYINDKTFLSFSLTNFNSYDAANNQRLDKDIELDLEKISNLIKKEIIEKENLNQEGNNYVYLNVYTNIHYHTQNDFQVTYTITKSELKKDEFIKYRLGFYEAETIKEKRTSKVNMVLDKDNKITYLNDNPKSELSNFEENLYNYIIENLLEKEDSDFFYYNNCEFAEDYEKCETERDYHNLIKEASYAIDKENNRLFVYENKPGIGMAESYVNAFVPLDIFKTKESTNE